MKTYPLRTFVHHILLIRLGIATALISLVIAAITYFTQETRLKHQVADYAKKGGEVIVSEVREVMQGRSLDIVDAVQVVVKQHRSSTVYDAGSFVYVQFYEPSLKVVAEWPLGRTGGYRPIPGLSGVRNNAAP